jgi:hypothetical protein
MSKKKMYCNKLIQESEYKKQYDLREWNNMNMIMKNKNEIFIMIDESEEWMNMMMKIKMK